MQHMAAVKHLFCVEGQTVSNITACLCVIIKERKVEFSACLQNEVSLIFNISGRLTLRFYTIMMWGCFVSPRLCTPNDRPKYTYINIFFFQLASYLLPPEIRQYCKTVSHTGLKKKKSLDFLQSCVKPRSVSPPGTAAVMKEWPLCLTMASTFIRWYETKTLKNDTNVLKPKDRETEGSLLKYGSSDVQLNKAQIRKSGEIQTSDRHVILRLASQRESQRYSFNF